MDTVDLPLRRRTSGYVTVKVKSLKVIVNYMQLFKINVDPRTKDWFLVKNPLYIMSILVPYLYVCLKIGPKYMEKRQAYSLKKFIFVYNILQILVNSKLVYSTYYAGWSDEISLGCEPVRRTTRPIDYQVSVLFHKLKFIQKTRMIYF